MFHLQEKNIIITGGASGIGKLMGDICLRKGAANLIIWDLNIEQVRHDERIHAYQVNVTDAEAIAEAYGKVKAEIGAVDLLINCAGVIRGNNTFDKQNARDITLTMDVNATAPMLVAAAILPDMIARNSGHICNIASAAGMLGIPKLSVYCASKWAVIGWSESLRIELKQAHSKVKVTAIAPYFINTGMFDGVKSKIFPILKPEKTAQKIIRAIEREKGFKGIPFPEHFIRFWEAVLPKFFFDWFFGKLFGIYEVMDHFTGRK